MPRRKGIYRFAAIISIIVLYTAFPAAALDCVWCNPVTSQSFVNCIYDGFFNSEVIINVPDSILDDMKTSMLAASTAIKRSRDVIKMKMMNGVMAGELAELIKSQSTYYNSEVITRESMQIIGNCFVRFTGQSHVGFIQELAAIVNILLKESEEASEKNAGSSIPLSPVLTNPVQTSTSSIAFGESNMNNRPYVNSFNNLPQQQAISAKSSSNSNSFISSQGNNRPGFISPSLRSDIPQSNNFAISQNYPVTPLRATANKAGAANFPHDVPNFVQNSANQQTNSASGLQGNNYDYHDNEPGRNDYDNGHMPTVKPNLKDYSAINFQNPIPLNIQPNVLANSAFQQKNYNSQATSVNIANGQTTGKYFPQDNFSQQANNNYAASNVNRINSLNNHISNVPNKYNQNIANGNSTNSDRGAFNTEQTYNNFRPNDNYKYSAIAPSTSQSSASNFVQNNVYSSNKFNYKNSGTSNSLTTRNRNQQEAYSYAGTSSGSFESFTDAQENSYPSSSNSDKKLSNLQAKRIERVVSKTATENNKNLNKQNYSSNRYNDAVGKAVRFSETVFVLLSSSDIFTRIFNTSISNGDAAFFAYKSVANALSDCGYAQYSEEIANACSGFVENIPEKASSDKYGEAFSKSLMSQFYNKQLISDSPEDQARYVTSCILTKLNFITIPQSSLNSSGAAVSSSSGSSTSSSSSSSLSSTSSSGSLSNNEDNTDDLGKNNSSSSEKQSHMAKRFYKTLCNRLQRSTYFRYVFNKKTHKAIAKCWAKPMLRNSFGSDYGNKLAREAEKKCVRRVSALPAHSRTAVYIDGIAKCLTNIFFYHDLILIDNPASEAISIASNINKWLKQALNDIHQSTTVTPQLTDYPTPKSNDYSTPPLNDYSTPQSNDYSTPKSNDYSTSQSNCNDNGQDYYKNSGDTDYANQQMSYKSSSATGFSKSVANENSNTDSSNTKDNINYPYYDNYPNQKSNTKSGTDNDYMFLYEDEYPNQKEPQRNSNNNYSTKVKPLRNQKKDTNSRTQNKGKKRGNRNSSWYSNAQSTITNDDTPVDNAQSSNDYRFANSNENTSQQKQTPQKTQQSNKSSPIKRILLLMKKIPSFISQAKFDYKRFGKFLRNLVKNMLRSYKSSKLDIRIQLLIECLIASLQLLTKAQSENTKTQDFKNANISNFTFSNWTSDSLVQENRGDFSKDKTNDNQPQETYSSEGNFIQNTEQSNSGSQSQVLQNNLNYFQTNQQNSYTNEGSGNAHSWISNQRQTNAIQPQALQDNWNPPPSINENWNPIRPQENLNPDAENLDIRSQYKQVNTEYNPQRTQNIYSYQEGSLNRNPVVPQRQVNWD